VRAQAIQAIADGIEGCSVPHPLRVAVDGRTASGKTTLADEVGALLRARGQPAVHAESGAIAIVDGSFLQRAELSEAWDLVVFVEVSEAVAVSRGAARDTALLGGIAAAREMHERRYQPAFALYDARCRPKDRADLVVVNDEPSAPRIVRTQRPGA
jgi:uridine kinase